MSLDALNPIEAPLDWQFCTVKGVDSPPCKMGDAKRSFKWDVKSGKGAQGGFVTYVGLEPMEFSVTFYLWTLDHFAAWDEFLPLLRYDPTKKDVQAVDFFHPSLEGLGLHSVVVRSIGNVVHEGNGLYSVTCEFLEYVPPPKTSAVSSPTSSATGPGSTDGTNAPAGTTPDPAVVAAQKEFDDALADAKAKGPI